MKLTVAGTLALAITTNIAQPRPALAWGDAAASRAQTLRINTNKAGCSA